MRSNTKFPGDSIFKNSDAVSKLIPFLDDKSLINLSLASKSHHKIIKKSQYRSFAHFIIAFSQCFPDKWTCWYAWLLYKETIESNNYNPVAIYSRKDKDNRIALEHKKFIMDHPSRIYSPGLFNHSWEFNLAWILAQIHMGRAFKVLSSPKDEYMKQDKHPERYSGFALEIAAAIKANYIIEYRKEMDEHSIYLSPPLCGLKQTALSIEDIRPSNAEIALAIDALKRFVQESISPKMQGVKRKA